MASNSKKRKLYGPDLYTDEIWKHTKGTVNHKLQLAQPYGFFLSGVNADKSTHTDNLTLSFPGNF